MASFRQEIRLSNEGEKKKKEGKIRRRFGNADDEGSKPAGQHENIRPQCALVVRSADESRVREVNVLSVAQ